MGRSILQSSGNHTGAWPRPSGWASLPLLIRMHQLIRCDLARRSLDDCALYLSDGRRRPSKPIGPREKMSFLFPDTRVKQTGPLLGQPRASLTRPCTHEPACPRSEKQTSSFNISSGVCSNPIRRTGHQQLGRFEKLVRARVGAYSAWVRQHKDDFVVVLHGVVTIVLFFGDDDGTL